MGSAKNGFLKASSVPPTITVESKDSISGYEYNGALESHGVDDDRDIRELHNEMTLVPTSSEVCSFREDELKVETPRTKHAKRPSAVTFHDPESNYMIGTNSEGYLSSIPVKPHAGKKITCYRCLKGDRLTVKEVCIVCTAEYCPGCVIRVMGSITMPQGRKCVTCIGYEIEENKRVNCSWWLKHKNLLDERSCEANQIPPELVRVNLQPLDKEQLRLLLNCSNPPKQLRPGSYWYDQESGLWGKEGQPPCDFISPQLVVGGRLQKNASNGNTKVTVNDREITKKELFILKFAGANADKVRTRGVYGRRVKFASALLSLPVPSTATLSDEGETQPT